MKKLVMLNFLFFIISCSPKDAQEDIQQLKKDLDETSQKLNESQNEILELKRKLSQSEIDYNLANHLIASNLNPSAEIFKKFYKNYAVLYTNLNYSKPFLTFYDYPNGVTPNNVHDKNLVKYNAVNKFILEENPDNRWAASNKRYPIERNFIYKFIESDNYIFAITQPSDEESRYDLIIWEKENTILIPIAIYPFIIGQTKYTGIDSIKLFSNDNLYIRTKGADGPDTWTEELFFKVINGNLLLTKNIFTDVTNDDSTNKISWINKRTILFDDKENAIDTLFEKLK